jgi:hypothetical protein
MKTMNPDGAADPAHSLEDKTVKLVAFTIVSVRRGAERTMAGALAAGTIVVPDSMSSQAFAPWMIERYLGSLSAEERWAIRPDLSYLRVDWVVSRRWPREPLEFPRRQLEALASIQGAIGGRTDQDS